MTVQKAESKSDCLARISTAWNDGPDKQALLAGAKALRIDQLDVAYLAIGANDSLKAVHRGETTNYDRIKKHGEIGQSEMVDAVVQAADHLLADAYEALGDDGFDGVWYYEVSEPLGAAIIEHWAEKGDMPNETQIKDLIKRIMGIW